MARYQNPLFTSAAAGDLGGSMGSIPTAPRGGGDPVGSVAGAVTKFANMALGGDAEFERARLYGAQRQAVEAETAGNRSLGEVISGWTDFSPEGIQQATRRLASAAAGAGIKPDQAFKFVQGLVATAQGTSEDSVARAVVAAGGGPLGKDQAYTTGGQSAIRADNERQNVAEYSFREGEANKRQGMAVGEQRRHNMVAEAEDARQFDSTPATVSTPEGPRIVRRSEAFGQSPVLDPLTVSPSATVLPQAGDPRVPGGKPFTAQAKPESLDQVIADLARQGVQGNPEALTQAESVAGLRRRTGTGQPLDVSPADTKALDELVGYQIPEGFAVAPEDRNAVLVRAGEIYQQTRNANTAVAQAWKEVMGEAPVQEGVGNPFKDNLLRPAPRSSAPAPVQATSGGDPVSQARAAISRGADRNAVIARLKSLNIPVPPDL